MRILLALLAALMFLSACGKKAPLRPPGSAPPGEEQDSPESGASLRL